MSETPEGALAMIDLDAALAAIRHGSVVGVPTDTVYGIAADPWQRAAVERLFEIKGRPGIKPIPILAGSLEDVRRVAVVDDAVAMAAGRCWPGALTVILRRVGGMPEWVGNSRSDSVGVRVPDHPVALELLHASGPLAVTSANRSADQPALDERGAEEVFGDSVAAYLVGTATGGMPSTVVDLTGPRPRLLRQGPIGWGEQ